MNARQGAAHKTWASETFGLSADGAAPMYDAFERAFSRHWLENGPRENRVIETWRRDDFLAGLEVAAVGSAVLDVERVDPGWLEQIARSIRGAKGGEEHGFIFELIACGMLAAGGMQIRPAPKAAPGHDAQLLFQDGYKLRLSFKNFEISNHETTFRKRCELLRLRFCRTVATGRPMRLGVQGLVHLDAEDFYALGSSLKSLRAGRSIEVRPGRVSAVVSQIFAEPGEQAFAHDRVSDQCIVLCPEHPKEQLRLESKLKNACLNMARHCPRTDNIGNFVLVRLHPAADTSRLEARALKLVREEVTDVDAIMLYQPAIVRTDDGKSVLVHHVRVVYGPRMDGRGNMIRLVPLVGLFSSQPSVIQLHGPSGSLMDLTNRYVYQAGDIYHAISVQDGSQGLLTNRVSGVRSHLIIRSGNSSKELQGLFPKFDHLRLL